MNLWLYKGMQTDYASSGIKMHRRSWTLAGVFPDWGIISVPVGFIMGEINVGNEKGMTLLCVNDSGNDIHSACRHFHM